MRDKDIKTFPDSTFGFEKPEDSLGFLLWQTTTTWQKLIKKTLDPYNLAHTHFVIMAVLLWFEEHQIQPSQMNIARLSKLDKMTVSKSLKLLSARGYINRGENQKDTRAKVVSLTIQGKKLVTGLVPIVEKIDENFFTAISQEDQKRLVQILNAVVTKNSV